VRNWTDGVWWKKEKNGGIARSKKGGEEGEEGNFNKRERGGN